MSDRLQNVSQHSGEGLNYYDGGKENFISKTQLKEIRSQVVTHEGETLTGQAGRNYMDNHSKQNLGKDLSNSYKNETIEGYVPKK